MSPYLSLDEHAEKERTKQEAEADLRQVSDDAAGRQGRSSAEQRPSQAGPPRSGAAGTRETGVGSSGGGAGAGSGGDVDPDIIGVGQPGGGSVSASGEIGDPEGADMTEGTSDDFASGRPATGAEPPEGKKRTPEGTVHDPMRSVEKREGA